MNYDEKFQFSNIADAVMHKFIAYGDKTAAVYINETITYRQLLYQVNNTANKLLLNGIKPGDVVGIYMDHSIPMIITLLAILRIKATYVPLDTSYPVKRLEYIINDSQMVSVITTQMLSDSIKPYIKSVITLNLDYGNASINYNVSDNIQHLAYIIYTSGSTGMPKGVCIRHNSVINFLVSMKRMLSATEDDVFLAHTTISFDISILEIFLPLMVGAKIIIVPRQLLYDSHKLISYIDKQKISIIQATPSLWHMLFEYGWSGNANLQAISGGEILHPRLAQKLLDTGAKVWNMYGPTEATIWSTAYIVKKINGGVPIPIGKPLNNLSIYLLNKENQIVPLGNSGEICISGIGIAEKYFNRPELTKERFINLIINGKKVLVYKTGDMGRIENGLLMYLGREDRQVKYHGYRIELEEIEHILLLHNKITAAVAVKLLRDNYGESIAIYFVSNVSNLDETELKIHLQYYLPEYMIPSVYIQLSSLPLTTNGKVNYNELPSPDVVEVVDSSVHSLELSIISIWQNLFKHKRIDSNSNFFELGGTSLVALKMIARIREQLGYSITIADLFLNSTIKELVCILDSHNLTDNLELIDRYKVIDEQQQVISFGQERMWFIEQYEGGTNVYNNQLTIKLAANTNINILKLALQGVVSRHEVLHSLIKISNQGGIYQFVEDLNKQPLIINQKVVNNKVELDKLITEEAQYIFKLNVEYPIRLTIYLLSSGNNEKIATDHYYLNLVVHHIAFDGWSTDIFIRDLHSYYDYYLQLADDKPNNIFKPKLKLDELSIQYKDFAIWQRKYLSGNILFHQLNYWKNILNNYENSMLPLDKQRPATIKYMGKNVYFSLDKLTSFKLRELAKDMRISLFSLLLSGYYLLIRSYSNQDDIVIGTPVANRQYHQLHNMIGLFVNSLVLRSQIDKNIKINDYIQQVSRNVLDAQLYQDLPFEKLVEELHVIQDTSRHPIFQVMFGLQSFGNAVLNEHFITSDGVDLNSFNSHVVAKFDITTMIDDTQDELTGVFNYAISLFNQETIEGYVETYKYILKQLIDNTQQKIYELCYLDTETYKKVIFKWNQTNQEYCYKPIHQLFEEQVNKTPNNVAVVCGTQVLTYKELNIKANQLAHYLKNNYIIQPDSLIAMCLDQSECICVYMLGILKTGAAYVPINPSYPIKRIAYIVKDARVRVILTSVAYVEKCNTALEDIELNVKKYSMLLDSPQECFINGTPKPGKKFGIDVLAIDSNEITSQKTSNLKNDTNSNNLAYVIYTSGTTGNPKGVMIEHKGVVSLVRGNDYIKINSNNAIAHLSDVAFDAATFEIYSALLNGAKLVIPSNRLELLADAIKLEDYLTSNNISVLWLTKTLFDKLYFLSINLFSSLKYLLVGGEALNYNLINKLANSKFKPQHIINGYGPTENTTFSCVYQIYNSDIANFKNVPIGKPLNNRVAYILNDNLIPLPVGAIGELYVGGVGLARGYLNLNDLTAQKFINNPFKTEIDNNSRLYKTGDLVRYLPDGNIEYIGRNDSQVKILGHRIELAEIEDKIQLYPTVKQTVVLPLVNSNRDNTADFQGIYLVAYYTSDLKIEDALMIEYLSNYLPQYMIPRAFIHLNQLPITSNGKIDLIKLPSPHLTLESLYVAPVNKAEFIICKVYAQVLNISQDKVGTSDDFFKLGGNSLLAVSLVSKLQLNFKISVNDIFILRTPYRIAKTISFVEDNLQYKLSKIKMMYQVLVNCVEKDENMAEIKCSQYFKKISEIKLTHKIKPFKNILLTGATGFLGCNVLNQLLLETQYNVFLLIRANSKEEAHSYITNKYKFYFNENLLNYSNRVTVILSDIEKADLGLETDSYNKLTTLIDSTIHCAALVKHYGEYQSFYQANVQATINLLEFSKFTKCKDFNYISTIGVFLEGYIPNYKHYIFNEDDNNEILENKNSLYLKTKYEGELAVIRYRNYGINSNIYRVGNLAMHSKNYINQENIQENAFFIRIHTMLCLGALPQELAEVEISPVDCTALAIVKLFNQAISQNKMYHVFNPNLSNLFNLLSKDNHMRLKMVSMEKFLNLIEKCCMGDFSIDIEQIELFMLHQGWLQDIDPNKVTKIKVMQDRTNYILNFLNFKWPLITTDMLSGFIEKLVSTQVDT
ncbi:MAG: hypothetical protein QG673_1449 [Pseudomonadota bacterium]|nr:hypothetical protein [Pseudomonadota bacterium]